MDLGICYIRVVMVRASLCCPSQYTLDKSSLAIVKMLSDSFGMIFTINNQQFQCQQYSYFWLGSLFPYYYKFIYHPSQPSNIKSTLFIHSQLFYVFWFSSIFGREIFLTLLNFDQSQRTSVRSKQIIRVGIETQIYFIYYFFVNLKPMSVKEQSINNKGKIALAVLGIGAAGALAYWLYKKFSTPETPTSVPHPDGAVNKVSVSSNASDNNSVEETYDQKFARIINETRGLLDASRNQITPAVITAIIRGQYDLANEDIKALILKSRKERRAKLEDTLQYAKIVTKFQLDLESLQEKHLGAILSRFNIDKAEWKEACNSWENRKDDQGLSDLIRDEEEKQLLSLKIANTKPKPYLFIEDILKFKIKTLQVLNPTQLGVELAADDAARYDLIETYVKDLVFKKYNIEQEDIEFSISQMSGMQKEKVVKLQDEIGFLMEKFIGQEDEEEQGNFY